jgi:lysophospholipase L1-like esterase
MAETPHAASPLLVAPRPSAPPHSTAARSREAFLRSVLIFSALSFGYLGLETSLGILAPAAGPVLNVYNRTTTAGLDCYPTDPRGYFDLDLRDPGTRERFESLHVRRVDDCAAYAPHAVELRYNSLQFRDREPGPRTPGVLRLAVLGDSFTEGQGVKERDTYPRALERALNRTGSSWEVLNFGRRGADFPALRNTFEELVEFEPDVVLYGMGLNDCEPSDALRARHPFVTNMLEGPRQKPELLQGPPPFGARTALFVQDRWERLRVDRGMTAWYGDLYGVPNDEGWQRTRASIVEMDRRMRLRGGRFLMATWPVLAHLDRDYPFRGIHETVGRFAHAAGIEWVDLLPVMAGLPADELWVHRLDPHPNERAHRLVAEALAPVVVRTVD